MKTLAPLPVIALALLAGCARFAYQPAQGTDVADVTFTSDGISVQPMVCVPGKGFKGTEYSVARTDGGEVVSQLNEAMRKKTAVTTQVAAGSNRIGFSFTESESSAGTRERCKIAVFFDAVAGAHYQAHFSMPGEQCALALTSEDDSQLEPVVVPWECP